MEKVTRNNYQKYYRKHYGIDYGGDMEIHHLDFNRDNNDIRNLILIPKEVHIKLHKCYDAGVVSSIEMFKNPKDIDFECAGFCSDIETIKDYMDAVVEMREWWYKKLGGYRYSCKDERVCVL